jgi:hypothetical protein
MKEISENIYINLDQKGASVSMSIEKNECNAV